MSYAEITDPSNTFATSGLSREVRAILDYILNGKRAGLDVVATSTTDHSKYSRAGYLSRHRQQGTDGEGLAVDCRMRQRGNGIHRAVFDMFVPVEELLHELIYARAPYNIKAGKRVAPYAVSTHHDHVHVAVAQGTFLHWPGARPQEVKPMFGPFDIRGVVASAKDRETGGVWLLGSDGAVFAFEGARGVRGVNGQGFFAGRQAARFDRDDQGFAVAPAGKILTVIATSGERYHLPW